MNISFFKKNYTFFLILSLITISLCGFVWSLGNHTIILYGDATSHLNIARRIIDSKTPGFAQLGSSWLPLFHLLLLPFVANDFLYRSGIAGYCVNALLFIFTGYFFSNILLYLFPDKKKYIFMLTLLFSLNANLVYFQTTAMGELLLLFSMTGGMYYLLQYVDNIRSTALLALAAFFIFLSSMNRYEGWFLACVEVAFIFIYTLLKSRKYTFAEGKTILFASLAFLGILTWLVYNFAIFHDPLNFIHDTHTAAGQQTILYKQGLLPTKHNIVRSIQTFSFAFLDSTGVIFSVLAGISLLWYIVKNRNIRYVPILLTFVAMVFFEILTLFLGITAMYVKQLYPFSLFNIRYAIFAYPALFLLLSIFILSRKNKLFVYCLFFCLFLQIIILFRNPISIQEGKDLFQTDQGMVQAGGYLKLHYTTGNILASAGTIDPLFLFSDIPLHNFIYEGNQRIWEKSLQNPQKYATWVVFKSSHDSLDFVAKNLENKPQLNKYYRFVTRKRNISIYERIK